MEASCALLATSLFRFNDRLLGGPGRGTMPAVSDRRTILHADMDAFYAAVEQLDRPELRGRPIIVGSSSGRGVVLTASYEARPFGVRSAMPSLQAKELCPDCLFVPPRMPRYAEVAKQIRQVFEELTPLVEPVSLDEAFLDVTGSLRLFGDALTVARRLKQRVRDVTGLTVSVGVGPTKMIAKIASDIDKPDGLVEVSAEGAAEFLRPLPVSRLWGVGPATLAKLQGMGIVTIGDIAARDRGALERQLGSLGPFLQGLAAGHDERAVEPGRQRKSYGEERTFARDRRDGPEIHALIRQAAEDIARRLRDDGRATRVVVLKLKLTNRIAPGKYPILTRRRTLEQATDHGPTIAAAALELWARSHGGRSVRLVGVSATEIEASQAAQPSLFGATTRQREQSLDRALDELSDRFGRNVVRRGRASSRER